MRALVFDRFGGPIEVRDVPDPEPAPDGVVIRVDACGLCRSDWHGWMGHDADVTLPHVPGHELAGVVVERGPEVTGWTAGARVTVPFSVGCGACDQCRAGHAQVCDRYFQPGFTAWGAFAERVAIPHADFNLVRLPEQVHPRTAAALGCRFGTAFRAVVDQGRVRDNDWVAVQGCGGVGLAAVMIAGALGARVVAVDIKADALALARSVGAEATVHAADVAAEHVAERIREITGGGAHVALDALGSSRTCLASIQSLRKRGRHVQIGVMAGEDVRSPIPMGAVMFNELELVGSHGVPAARYDAIFEMMAAGRLDPGRLVTRVVSLADVASELPAMGAFPGTGIVVADMSLGTGEERR